MKGTVWFAAGAVAGIYAVIKGRQAAEALTPDGLRDRAQALGVGMRMLRDEVAQGKVEKEAELRERLVSTRLAALAGSSNEGDAGSTYKQIEEGTQ